MIHMILSAGVRLHFRAALDPFTRAMLPSGTRPLMLSDGSPSHG